jgi:hypothetical protein
MLRLMLDSHPELAIPPETHFIPLASERCMSAEDPVAVALDTIIASERWRSFGLDGEELRARAAALRGRSLSDALRMFYEAYAEGRGKARWGDKTPWYVLKMPMISELLPEAHFVQVIRDGRDVALSVIPLWFGPNSVPEAASWWAERVRRGRRDAAEVPYLEVRYELLVQQPEAELHRLCGFAGLEFDRLMLAFADRVRDQPEVVAPHLLELPLAAARAAEPEPRGSLARAPVSPQEMQARLARRLSGPPDNESIGRWRTEMTADELRSFNEIAGDLLEELGYPLV